MAVDAVTQAEDVALVLHPLLVGVAHPLLDAGMADGLERARKVTGVFLPQGADQLPAPLGVGLVPHGDVVLNEGLHVGHGQDLARSPCLVDDLRGNLGVTMKSWAKIDGGLADYVDANWLREGALKRRLREETVKTERAGMQISAHQGQQIAL